MNEVEAEQPDHAMKTTMKGENPDWQPEGQRWLEKIECEKCSGVGFLISRTERICALCSGDGFIESSGSDVILCTTCNGVRKVASETKATCEDCKGRGYTPKIMQRFKATIDCDVCDGTGNEEVFESSIDYHPDDYQQCPDCEGLQKEEGGAYCSIPKWRSSPLYVTRLSTDDCSDGVYRLQSGAFVTSVACPECETESNPECALCEGRGKVILISKACKRCKGFGEVEKRHFCKCYECDGSGKVSVSDDREV